MMFVYEEPGKEYNTMRENSLEAVNELTNQYISRFPEPVSSTLSFAKDILHYEVQMAEVLAVFIPVGLYCGVLDPSPDSLRTLIFYSFGAAGGYGTVSHFRNKPNSSDKA